jgi:hypothetical protein
MTLSSLIPCVDFANETQRFQELYAESQNVVFNKPTGGQAIAPTLNARLKIPANTGYKVSGKIDLKPLNELLNRWSIKPDSEIKLYLLSTRYSCRNIAKGG